MFFYKIRTPDGGYTGDYFCEDQCKVYGGSGSGQELYPNIILNSIYELPNGILIARADKRVSNELKPGTYQYTFMFLHIDQAKARKILEEWHYKTRIGLDIY